mmetsp:Transcript_10947/g.15214  ORF Transcript_10947/g.15214 Transcript_10947/m.15214 type:complete len:90 (+) Transcript_10947:179-448(+)
MAGGRARGRRQPAKAVTDTPQEENATDKAPPSFVTKCFFLTGIIVFFHWNLIGILGRNDLKRTLRLAVAPPPPDAEPRFICASILIAGR